MLIPFITYLTIITVIAGIYYHFTEWHTLKQIVDIYLKAILTKPLTNLLGIEVLTAACGAALWYAGSFRCCLSEA